MGFIRGSNAATRIRAPAVNIGRALRRVDQPRGRACVGTRRHSPIDGRAGRPLTQATDAVGSRRFPSSGGTWAVRALAGLDGLPGAAIVVELA